MSGREKTRQLIAIRTARRLRYIFVEINGAQDHDGPCREQEAEWDEHFHIIAPSRADVPLIFAYAINSSARVSGRESTRSGPFFQAAANSLDHDRETWIAVFARAHGFKLKRFWRSGILVEHDLFGRPVATFPDHALKIALKKSWNGTLNHPAPAHP